MKKIILILLTVTIANGPLVAHDLLSNKTSITTKVYNFVRAHPKLIGFTACLGVASFLYYKFKQYNKQDLRAKEEKERTAEIDRLKEKFGAEKKQCQEDRNPKPAVMSEEERNAAQKKAQLEEAARLGREVVNDEKERVRKQEAELLRRRREQEEQIKAEAARKEKEQQEQDNQRTMVNREEICELLKISPKANCFKILGLQPKTTAARVKKKYEMLLEFWTKKLAAGNKEQCDAVIEFLTEAKDQCLRILEEAEPFTP